MIPECSPLSARARPRRGRRPNAFPLPGGKRGRQLQKPRKHELRKSLQLKQVIHRGIKAPLHIQSTTRPQQTKQFRKVIHQVRRSSTKNCGM